MSFAEAQRLSLARELHDTVLQEFLVIVMQLRRVEEIAGGPDRTRRVDHALQASARGIECVRRLLGDLRSPTSPVADAGPAVSLSDEVASTLDAVVGHAPLRSTLRCPDALYLRPSIQREIVKVVREAATNAMRHAAARSIACRVVSERGELRVTVQDDGRGFQPSAGSGGHGLTGMRERAALIGATLEIGSRRDGGTTIGLTLPIGGALRSDLPIAVDRPRPASVASTLRKEVGDACLTGR